MSPELVRAYARTFIGRDDCYPLQRDIGSYWSIKRPLTLAVLTAHVRGDLTIGAYALDAQSCARWLCLDADETEQWLVFKDIAQRLEADGMNAYLETSRRGGHLWLFTAPTLGSTIRKFGIGLVQCYGSGKIALSGQGKIELYPKQDNVKSGLGSLVRLPLGIHRKTGKRYPFITPDDKLLSPTIRQQMALLADPMFVPQNFISEICAEVPEMTPRLPHPSPLLPKVRSNSGETLSERLKNAIRVYDFVRQYIELDQFGKGLCPFHDDHIQSFQVNIEANYWSCYAGCGGGSIIDFAMKWRIAHGQDGSFTATIKDLAQELF